MSGAVAHLGRLLSLPAAALSQSLLSLPGPGFMTLWLARVRPLVEASDDDLWALNQDKCRAAVGGLGPCGLKLALRFRRSDHQWLDQALRGPGSWLGRGAWEPGYEGGAGGPVPVCILSCCVTSVGSLPILGLASNQVSGPKVPEVVSGPNLGSVDP